MRCERLISGPARKVSVTKITEMRRMISQIQQSGKPFYSFLVGDSVFPMPDYIKYREMEALCLGKTKYTHPEGIPELREGVIADCERQGIAGFNEENVIITDGGLEALYLAFKTVCDLDSEVIVPSPYYMFYPDQVKIAGGIPKIVPTSFAQGFKLTPELLEEAITEKTKALVLNNPHNPTGAVYTREELRTLAEVAKERELLVITDEVYDKYVYEGEYICFASLDPDLREQTITINSASKRFAMSGERIGWAVGPKELISCMINLKNYTTYGAGSVAQWAVAAALEHPEHTAEEIEAAIAAYRIRRDLMLKYLDNLKLRYVRPQGAFYVFPELPDGLIIPGYEKKDLSLSEKFAFYLLEETGVAVAPGIDFGSGNHIRITFIVDEKTIKEGMEKVGNVLADLK